MRRRDFLIVLGSAVCWPLAVRAQQSAMPVIGFLHFGSPAAYADEVAAFRQGLEESGYTVGQNLAIEYCWANGDLDRLQKMAADLAGHKVEVIVAGGGATSALAARAATSTIPIVVSFGSDPVALGLAASLNRPGGNITGVTFLTTDLTAKRLDILHQVVPQAKALAYLEAAGASAPTQLQDVLAAANALGLEVAVVRIGGDGDFERAFEVIGQRQAAAILVGAFPFFSLHRVKLIELAARHKLPIISQAREISLDGGLMSYGASRADAFHLSAHYVARILKGAKPAEMPITQSEKFELVINLKTARALGLAIPPNVLAIADEVIE